MTNLNPTQRTSIPTGNEKQALRGTVGDPAYLNPYVTDMDPRVRRKGEIHIPFFMLAEPLTF